MSKPKVAPATPREQAPRAADAIPLSEITITCYRQPHFAGEEGQQPITIPGKQLGQILAWLAQTRPGLLGKPDKDLWDPVDVALDLEGLGGVLRGLGEADFAEIPIHGPSVLCLLSDVASDLAARLQASEDGDGAIAPAMITLPTRKAAAA
jgi:hypothetical protein